MAQRLLKHHQDSVRQKIQAIKLIQYLGEHAEGQREMTTTQVQAAKILLDKSVSNAPTDLNVNGDLNVNIVRYGDNDSPAE